MKNNIRKFLGGLAELHIAYRGTLEDLASCMMGYDYNDIRAAVLEMIEANEIVYIIDEDTYTLTIKEEDE